MIDPRAVVDAAARIDADVHIGPYSIIGAGVQIGRGTRIEPHVVIKGKTTIGADNHVFQFASIAGHVHVGDYAILGGFTAVHQFCRIGPHTLTSMFSYVTKDIPAFVTVSGRPAEPRGINAEGLKRRGFNETQIRNIREGYRALYRQSLKLEEAIAEIERRLTEQPELKLMLDSLRSGGSRGVAR